MCTVYVNELRQGADWGIVEPQGDEAMLLVQRVAKAERLALQLRPVRAERIDGHAEHQHARLLQPFLNLRLAGLGLAGVSSSQHPFIEPHLQPVLAHSLRQFAHYRFVFRTVAQEKVVLEYFGHGHPLPCWSVKAPASLCKQRL